MVFRKTRVDLAASQRMLDEGKTVREIAESQRVSRQAIYGLLKRGTLVRRDSFES